MSRLTLQTLLRRFQYRLGGWASPRRPRQRALRIALGVVGLALLAVLLLVSAVLGLAMLAAGMLWRAWRGRTPARAPLNAAYRVVGKPQLARG
jgi:hypothetical protein